MTALADALAVQHLRRKEAECAWCGDGPDSGAELRMIRRDAGPQMICGPCFHARPTLGHDFTALPIVWRQIDGAHE